MNNQQKIYENKREAREEKQRVKNDYEYDSMKEANSFKDLAIEKRNELTDVGINEDGEREFIGSDREWSNN